MYNRGVAYGHLQYFEALDVFAHTVTGTFKVWTSAGLKVCTFFNRGHSQWRESSAARLSFPQLHLARKRKKRKEM